MNDHTDPLSWARLMERDSPDLYDIDEALISEYKIQAENIKKEIDLMEKAGRPYEEIEDLILQGENIHAMISDIFTIRLKKIMAVARDWPHIEDRKIQAILPWERDFFDQVVTLVEEYRDKGWIE